ncbi:MAG: gamma-glutamyltransferase [Saprospiraceae bacterium]|nr:gamma-glutamyltransferase [Saprospiraceae bacterium]
MSRILFLCFVISLLLTCKQTPEPANHAPVKSAVEENGMVVTAHPLATEIGVQILKSGGNAVDASIAVQFALAVCFPVAGNLGGGGFMLYRSAQGQVAALDYRESAPALSSKDMYLDEKGNAVTERSLYGHLACGIPGTVAGLYEAFQKYSQLKDWKTLVEPAILLAKKGVVLTAKEAEGLNDNRDLFLMVNKESTVFTDKVWKEGDLLIQADLAKTLERIRDHGKDGFYKGETAKYIVEEMKNGGGIISSDDLANYQAKWRTPLSTTYRGYKVHLMPPPSSGGVALIQLLESVEPFDIRNMGFQSVATIHLMVEAERRVYADRSRHLGDSDYYRVPVKGLTDSTYIATRMKNFDQKHAGRSTEMEAGQPKESDQTTHLSIVDKDGNAVAVTTTLNGGYGSSVVVRGAGFILNNEMDDFSVKPGVANLYGLIGAEANKIEPGKRMLSSMTPTIVEKGGKLRLVVGTPGGSTIITSVFQTIVNILDFQMDPADAVARPRFHHQWLPDSIQVEKGGLSDTVIAQLKTKGHGFKFRKPYGRVEAIYVTPDGKLHGGADPRGDDHAAGY